MLIKEKIVATESGIEIQKTFDNDVYIEQAKAIRDQGLGQTGESRLVGRIPMHLVSKWIKDAGLNWSDKKATQDLIRTKMLSGDFDKFRVWKGTY
jgi:hypothetical protein